ncbi:hypothetical protein TSOC_012429, partial [Tetrabaena socialis]
MAFDAGGVGRTLVEAWHASEEAMAEATRKAAFLPGWSVNNGTIYDADGTPRDRGEAWEARLEATCRSRGYHFTPAAERAQ